MKEKEARKEKQKQNPILLQINKATNNLNEVLHMGKEMDS